MAIVPYADLVGAENPLDLLASTPQRIANLVKHWDVAQWSSTYAPGKWNAAQLILHLAHDEIGWSNRIRLALTVKDYVIQPYEGADWVDLESPTDGQVALTAYIALRRLNLILYRHITPEQLAKSVPHPDRGNISIEWILRLLAGHDLHHFRHLEMITSQYPHVAITTSQV
jgi:hypothetical protein